MYVHQDDTSSVQGSDFVSVPLYGISSWWGLKNFTVAAIIDPVRDIYEVLSRE